MSKTITLPDDLVAAIDSYLDTDWSDGRDPSRFGALNIVAFIGERVAAIYRESRALNARPRKAGAP